MKITGGFLFLVVLFFVAVWAGTKWPALNVIAKVTG
jgi:hypothetical protein